MSESAAPPVSDRAPAQRGMAGVGLTELVLDRAHNAAITIDQQGLVTYWNPSAENTFGLASDQALGQPITELIIPERLREAHLAGLRRFLADGSGPILDRRIEMTALRADGREFPVEMTICAVRHEEGWFFHAFLQDVTDRRRSEVEREQLVTELRRALRGSERRFDAIVGEFGDPVTIRDREHRLVYANPAALAQLGFASLQQLRETDPDDIMKDYLVSGEDGGEIVMQDIPSVRLLRGEEAEPLLIRTIRRGTGVQRWSLLKSAPLLDEEGEVEATITIIEDVTEQKRAERGAAFLAQASAALASSLAYEQTLRNVADLAVPGIADWCAVDLIDDEGDRSTVAVAHVDRARLKLAEELRRYSPQRPDPARGLGRVLRTGEAELYEQITDQMIADAAVDARHLELLRAVGFRSALIVPMRLGGRVLGAMTLVNEQPGRPFDRTDLELAEQVGSRAAVAIENSRLYSERSSIARTLQQSLLPEELPPIAGYELASIYLPALEASMVGGDFYDVWSVGDSWMLVIGDVTGKGVDAAALTALVRHTLRTASEFQSSPAQLLATVDSTLKKQPRLTVCTALCMRLDHDTVTLAVGGHPLPLHLLHGQIRQLGHYGPLLGAFAETDWREVSVELQPGSTLVAYTDGVTDARGEDDDRFGLQRLTETLLRLGDSPAGEMMDGLVGELNRYQTGVHTDDTAALALCRLE